MSYNINVIDNVINLTSTSNDDKVNINIAEPAVVNIVVSDKVGPQGPPGETGTGVASIVAGANITVDNTDPANPVVSATGGGSSEVTHQLNPSTTGLGITYLATGVANDLSDAPDAFGNTGKFIRLLDMTNRVSINSNWVGLPRLDSAIINDLSQPPYIAGSNGETVIESISTIQTNHAMFVALADSNTQERVIINPNYFDMQGYVIGDAGQGFTNTSDVGLQDIPTYPWIVRLIADVYQEFAHDTSTPWRKVDIDGASMSGGWGNGIEPNNSGWNSRYTLSEMEYKLASNPVYVGRLIYYVSITSNPEIVTEQDFISYVNSLNGGYYLIGVTAMSRGEIVLDTLGNYVNSGTWFDGKYHSLWYCDGDSILRKYEVGGQTSYFKYGSSGTIEFTALGGGEYDIKFRRFMQIDVLPEPTMPTDEGKVITVAADGSYVLDEVTGGTGGGGGLPDIATGDALKLLRVNATEDAVEWTNAIEIASLVANRVGTVPVTNDGDARVVFTTDFNHNPSIELHQGKTGHLQGTACYMDWVAADDADYDVRDIMTGGIFTRILSRANYVISDNFGSPIATFNRGSLVVDFANAPTVGGNPLPTGGSNVPDQPTTDGTYVLKITGGVATWEELVIS